MSQQQRVFGVANNNKGLPCPFTPILCQEGSCHQCQIYLDRLEVGADEIVVICAWCSQVISRKPNPFWRQVISHGLCPECRRKHFPGPLSQALKPGGSRDG
ncbi:hypothetical protein LCGC14_0262410 [marine sediment metagenome]|uniref:Uncharacterized protein n=1 Tax=marine sediment metagenome TaxID=412755 RepID=A0A0F9UHX9_9ZZZZ